MPAADAYCTDQPVRSTAAAEVLRSSTKSLVKVAPELPPPPYTWLIATSAEAAEVAGDGGQRHRPSGDQDGHGERGDARGGTHRPY